MAGCGTVPVPLACRRVGDVARADLSDAAAAGLHETPAFGDVEGLPEGVGVPRGAGGGEKRTALTRTREGSSPLAMPSIQTSPVNHSAGPFAVGWLARNSTGVSLLMG